MTNQDKAMASTPAAGVKKRGWSYGLRLHTRRIALEIINLIVNHDWLFYLIGRTGIIESVFLVYPANDKYALAYVYPKRLPKVRWNPWPGGLLWQNGRLGIMFVISANNGSFVDQSNLDNLRHVVERMERLRQLLRAKYKTFAGILPGVLQSQGLLKTAPEAEITALAVVQAIDKIRRLEALSSDVPVVVLGGSGFIGRRVVGLLKDQQVYSLDTAVGQGRQDWPKHLVGQPLIVVNITVKSAISDYIDLMWPGTVVVNEVYPEPSFEVADRLKQQGCSLWHVVGVKALALPAFPRAYQGAIPCCAAWPSSKMEVKVRKLI